MASPWTTLTRTLVAGRKVEPQCNSTTSRRLIRETNPMDIEFGPEGTLFGRGMLRRTPGATSRPPARDMHMAPQWGSRNAWPALGFVAAGAGRAVRQPGLSTALVTNGRNGAQIVRVDRAHADPNRRQQHSDHAMLVVFAKPLLLFLIGHAVVITVALLLAS
jgi:hypothetical protein